MRFHHRSSIFIAIIYFKTNIKIPSWYGWICPTPQEPLFLRQGWVARMSETAQMLLNVIKHFHAVFVTSHSFRTDRFEHPPCGGFWRWRTKESAVKSSFLYLSLSKRIVEVLLIIIILLLFARRVFMMANVFAWNFWLWRGAQMECSSKFSCVFLWSFSLFIKRTFISMFWWSSWFRWLTDCE